MKRVHLIGGRSRFSCLVVLYASSLLGVAHGSATSQEYISVKDVVRFARIGDEQRLISWSEFWPLVANGVATFAPDGKHVAVLGRRGNPDTESNEATLLVYRSSELTKSPEPIEVARFASKTNGAAIAKVQWLDDSRSLVFAATNGTEATAVYRVTIEERRPIKLTHETSRAWDYEVSSSGDRLVLLSEERPMPPSQDPECITRGCLVKEDNLAAAELGMANWKRSFVFYDLSAGVRRAIDGSIENLDSSVESCMPDMRGGLSPNGRYAVVMCRVKPNAWPSWWEEYTLFNQELRSRMAHGDGWYVQMLLDFEQVKVRQLSAAPIAVADEQEPIWIESGRRVILINAAMPLVEVDEDERKRRAAAVATYILDPESGAIEVISRERIAVGETTYLSQPDLRWSEGARTLTVDEKTYQKRGDRWVAGIAKDRRHDAGVTSPDGRIRLLVDEGINHAPRLVAVDTRSKQRTVVLDPNRWVAQRKLGRVEETSWMAKNGAMWRGGIYYPPNYVPGKRYPLLVQTHGFFEGRFDLSGVARNFVAQPVAAHDIIVLQLEERIRAVDGASDEAQVAQGGHEAAIDHLHSMGLIDRERVGIIGWSRTGFHVLQTLAHSSYPVAAAALTSTGSYGYWWYLLQGGVTAVGKGMEAEYGASPFGEDIDVWRQVSPSFSLDRATTPMFMWENQTIAGLWDVYAILRRFSVPVEYWVSPDGEHEPFKVGERVKATQLLVDWFRFWLKDEEDPDPLKAAQYERWRKMRVDRMAVATH